MKASQRLLLLSALIFCVILSSCLKNNGVSEIGTWKFSGVIIDGATEKALNRVQITYLSTEGVEHCVLSDTSGKFFIDNLPYGERTFTFSIDSGNSYTSKRVVVSSYAEASSIGGVIGDVSRIVRLYPLKGSINGALMYQPKGTEYELPAVSASVRLVYKDSLMENTEPASFTAVTDSNGKFNISQLPLAPGAIISFDNFKSKNVSYTLASKSLNFLNGREQENLDDLVYTTTDTAGGITTILTSNVLSTDGFGKTGVSVNDTIWYQLPVRLQSGSLSVTINGTGSPAFTAVISLDTLFLIPRTQLNYDTLIEVKISGLTTDGERFDLTLDGVSRFRTERCPYPIEANFWSQPWTVNGRFGMGQTLWVRFSEVLDTSKSVFNWTTSSAALTLYGSGSSANSTFRISADTLFVTPDQRLNIAYNSTMGFNVQCRTIDGKYLKYYDFGVNTIEDPLYLVWTNTRDGQGKTRNDMGLLDTIKLVSSMSGYKVIGFSVGDTGIVPPGLMLSDVKVSGDTIICILSLSLVSDTAYSIDFDLQFTDNTIRRDVLGVRWITKKKVTIVSVDTKRNGNYRPLAAIGDSFKVTFSEPIDTSINASVAFRVNIKDVKNVTKRTLVRWDKECRTATILLLDTLPTADYDAPAAYTATATRTMAVASVTFDLVTKTGEQVIGCKPDGDPVALHTEKGLCIVKTNIISNLDGRTSVEKDFTPVTGFPRDGVIELEFNRIIDTSRMRMDSLTLHAGVHKGGAVIVPVKVAIKQDLKTLLIDPVDSLEAKTDYYIWVKNIPALKIFGAAAINKHGGTFTGQSSSAYLLDRPFKTQ